MVYEMGSKQAIRCEDYEKNSNVYYDSTIYQNDSTVSGSFSLKIREINLVLIGTSCGRETLSDLRVTQKETSVYEIPPAFLEGQELCERFVGHILSGERIDSKIQEYVIPRISKAAVKENLLRGEKEEEERKCFLIGAEFKQVKQILWENWKLVEESDPKYRERPIEQECIICLDELSCSSSEQLKKKKTIMKLRCGHNFHKDCLYSWLSCKQSCPTCRGEINYRQK